MTAPAENEAHELSVTRHINAPPEKVWAAMVDRIPEWFCPRPWHAEITHQERRAGGPREMVMRGPEGEEMHLSGTYLAWDEGRRFAVTNAITGDLQPAKPFMIGIWEIADEAGGTRYTATARHWTAEAKAQNEAMGFYKGWTAVADQLAELCETPI